MLSYTFSRELRLLTPREFDSVFQNPFRVASPLFTLLCKPNQLDHPRIGLTVAKKRAKLATQRNRIKRCARDIVLMVKGDISNTDNAELHQQLERLWSKIARQYKALAPKS